MRVRLWCSVNILTIYLRKTDRISLNLETERRKQKQAVVNNLLFRETVGLHYICVTVGLQSCSRNPWRREDKQPGILTKVQLLSNNVCCAVVFCVQNFYQMNHQLAWK